MDKASMMEMSLFKNVKVKTTDGETYAGKVKVFESAYDNDRDECSICLLTGNDYGICLMESEIREIEIIEL